MSLQAVIFSPEPTRGPLISRVIEKKGLKTSLHKNIRDATEALCSYKPRIVIVDKEGYFPSELSYFCSLTAHLGDAAVLFVADSERDDSLFIPNVPTDWCVSYPMDLELVAAKAIELLKPKEQPKSFKHLLPDTETPTEDEKVVIEDEALEDDLMGFIGLK